MIMEDFVTFEIAKKLKEKGFKEKCIAHYWEKINEHTPCFILKDNMQMDGICITDLLSEHNKAKWSPFIDAPTIAQALKWLREKKGLHIELWTKGKRPIKWHHTIHTLNHSGEREGWSSGEVCDSYEETALEGIKYILDNLI